MVVVKYRSSFRRDISAQSHDILNSVLPVCFDHLPDRLFGGRDTGEVGEHIGPVLLLQVCRNAGGMFARASAGPVGDTHEIRPESGNLLRRLFHRQKTGLGLGRKHLE